MSRMRRPQGPKPSAYITREGYERFRRELDHLWNVERPKVVQGVADAAAEGDRSENAEYIYGKKKLREIDRRVQFLTKRLDELKMVDPEDRKPGEIKIFFGAWVRTEDEDGEERVWRIVGPDEHDMHPLYVSMDSPIGKTLLGKKLDDELTIRRPKGDLEVTIVEVGYRRFPDVPDAEPVTTRGAVAKLMERALSGDSGEDVEDDSGDDPEIEGDEDGEQT
ncbi:MAG: transcription elongation factor GreB [Sandaracinus sp.]|nr:transcription elongation factor GreB [Sandaracinus sp.]